MAIQGVAQDCRDDLFRIEMRLRQPARRPAMTLVVGVDGVECLGGLQRRDEAEYALAVREERAWAGVLDDDRLAAGQVTDRSVADPGGLELDVGRLGATELAARTLDVRLIHFG